MRSTVTGSRFTAVQVNNESLYPVLFGVSGSTSITDDSNILNACLDLAGFGACLLCS